MDLQMLTELYRDLPHGLVMRALSQILFTACREAASQHDSALYLIGKLMSLSDAMLQISADWDQCGGPGGHPDTPPVEVKPDDFQLNPDSGLSGR